ncbi:MAG: serine protease, partial [Synergistales bacterium]|nr:serine protease [Synergistales bacterium]
MFLNHHKYYIPPAAVWKELTLQLPGNTMNLKEYHQGGTVMTPFHRPDTQTIARAFILAAALFLVPPALPEAAAQQKEADILVLLEERRREIASLMERAVVYVLVDHGGSISMGTGFVVTDGYVVTNAHVVEGKGTIVLVNPDLKPVQATLVRMEHGDEPGANDFALLRFSSGTSLPSLVFSPRVS